MLLSLCQDRGVFKDLVGLDLLNDNSRDAELLDAADAV